MQNKKSINISEEQVDQLADLFSLMGDTSRLRIILCCLHEPISVSNRTSWETNILRSGRSACSVCDRGYGRSHI